MSSKARSAKDAANAAVVKPEPTVFRERIQFDLSSFPCPRCEKPMSADSYAPCQDCIAQLKASQQTEASGEGPAAYEPKMNVTPNAVALKDD